MEDEFKKITLERTEIRKFHSDIVGQDYEIFVALPKSYSSSDRHYPVIYQLDPFRVFGMVKELTDVFTTPYTIIPEVIVVGIGYGGEGMEARLNWVMGRTRDYTPVYDSYTEERYEALIQNAGITGMDIKTGGAPLFLNFLRDELIPFVESDYRIDEDNRMLSGHSFGGLFSLYALFQAPDLFRKYFIGSPSIYFSDELPISYERKYAESHTDLDAEVFMSVGGLETRTARHVGQMAELLRSRNYRSLILETKVFENESHVTCYPASLSRALVELYNNVDYSQLSGPYLGQTPPGIEPEIFAPGIISTGANEGSSFFSKDGKTFMFTRGNAPLSGIFIMKKEDGIWSPPVLAPFSAGQDDWDFTLSPDNQKVVISSGRPIVKDGESVTDYRLWISEKSPDGWSEPWLLPYPVNSGQHDSYPSLTADETLYFFSNRTGGHGRADLYISRKENGKYSEVKLLEEPLNSTSGDLDPYIAPDESYLVICSDRPGGYGSYDIYIAFREPDGEWSDPVNMGEKINSSGSEYIPGVSPDGKYFFFTSNKSGDRDIYWVDTSIFKVLKK